MVFFNFQVEVWKKVENFLNMANFPGFFTGSFGRLLAKEEGFGAI